jgi:hypothetical protein
MGRTGLKIGGVGGLLFVVLASSTAWGGMPLSPSGSVNMSWTAGPKWGRQGANPMTFHGRVDGLAVSGSLVAHDSFESNGFPACAAKVNSHGTVGSGTFSANASKKCGPLKISGQIDGVKIDGTASSNGECGLQGTCYTVTAEGSYGGHGVTATMTLTNHYICVGGSDVPGLSQGRCNSKGTLIGTYHIHM